jgi:hypothetical protein
MGMEIESGHAWVQERTGDPACPFCAALDWLPLDSVNGVVVVEPAEALEPSAGNQLDVEERDLTTISSVAFACKRCGFVRFHMHPGG